VTVEGSAQNDRGPAQIGSLPVSSRRTVVTKRRSVPTKRRTLCTQRRRLCAKDRTLCTQRRTLCTQRRTMLTSRPTLRTNDRAPAPIDPLPVCGRPSARINQRRPPERSAKGAHRSSKSPQPSDCSAVVNDWVLFALVRRPAPAGDAPSHSYPEWTQSCRPASTSRLPTSTNCVRGTVSNADADDPRDCTRMPTSTTALGDLFARPQQRRGSGLRTSRSVDKPIPQQTLRGPSPH
jgi:hypothetical protein